MASGRCLCFERVSQLFAAMRKVASAPCLASLANPGPASMGAVAHYQTSGMHKSASVPVLHSTKLKVRVAKTCEVGTRLGLFVCLILRH